jgi:transposase
MAIKRHKRGDKVYLAEYKSIRKGDKVVSKFVRYIGREDAQTATNRPSRKVIDRLDLARSYRSGDVRLLWSLAEDLGFVQLIDKICCSKSTIEGPTPGKLLTVWAINRAIDPESATKLERWVPTTDLPHLTGLPPESFTKDAFLTALDFVCQDDSSIDNTSDLSTRLDEALYRKWREANPLSPAEKEVLAYDMTTLLFFGVSCPLAELGYNPDRIRRKQANLALLVSKRDRYPMMHFVYNGSRHSISTVKNLIACLNQAPTEPGTLIWDRGNVSRKHVEAVVDAGWKLICGVPKTSLEAKEIIGTTEIPVNPETLVRSSRAGHIYAVKAKGMLYDMDGSAIVYTNRERGVRDADARNDALAAIGSELDELGRIGKNWSEKRLHSKINTIMGSWKRFIVARVSRKNNNMQRISWSYKKQEIKAAERSDGKWLLLSTDPSLDVHQAVNMYLEKDFIEKAFRVLKTHEEVEPVRHRLEHRVRAYLFVCMLAYRLIAALQWKIDQAYAKEDAWESAYDLLQGLARVERVEVRFGNEIKTWYLNLTGSMSSTLKDIGAGGLFKEDVRIAEDVV